MVRLNISPIEIKFADYSYTVEEIVDKILKDKLGEDVKKFSKSGLKIDRVYKAHDLYKIDLHGKKYSPPDVKLNDLFVQIGKNLLNNFLDLQMMAW